MIIYLDECCFDAECFVSAEKAHTNQYGTDITISTNGENRIIWSSTAISGVWDKLREMEEKHEH